MLLHKEAPRFVAGQAQAGLQLMDGKENLPVTAWQPEALSGHRSRPTLLSNAETFAQIGHLAGVGPKGYAAHGTVVEPGTTLLTLRGDGMDPEVREVAFGTPLKGVLTDAEMIRPLLLGGYHGTWLTPAQLRGLRVSRIEIAAAGATLGAGVMLPLAEGVCPRGGPPVGGRHPFPQKGLCRAGEAGSVISWTATEEDKPEDE